MPRASNAGLLSNDPSRGFVIPPYAALACVCSCVGIFVFLVSSGIIVFSAPASTGSGSVVVINTGGANEFIHGVPRDGASGAHGKIGNGDDSHMQCPKECIRSGPMPAVGLHTPRLVNETAMAVWMSRQWATDLGLQGDIGRNDYAGAYTAALSATQRRFGIAGGVAEIGVHHGLSLATLMSLMREGERALAVDLFQEHQSLNIDRSGNGDESIMKHNLAALGAPTEVPGLVVHRGSSLDVTPAQFCSLLDGMPLRLISIDGGHTAGTVRHDMRLAECALAEGGIVIMDDYSNNFWPGVAEGVTLYLHENRGRTRLAPFLLAANKLFLTTGSYQGRYLEDVVSWPYWREACTWEGLVSNGVRYCMQAPGIPSHDISPAAKFNISGWPVAIADHPVTFEHGRTMALWQHGWNKS